MTSFINNAILKYKQKKLNQDLESLMCDITDEHIRVLAHIKDGTMAKRDAYTLLDCTCKYCFNQLHKLSSKYGVNIKPNKSLQRALDNIKTTMNHLQISITV